MLQYVSRWGRGTIPDVQTPIDGDETAASLSAAQYGSVFFKKEDVVLVGKSSHRPKFADYKYKFLLQLTTT